MVWLFNCRMPGGASKGKVKKHFKAKHQKKRVFRSSDPVLSVFMWGINHTVSVCVSVCRIIPLYPCWVMLCIQGLPLQLFDPSSPYISLPYVYTNCITLFSVSLCCMPFLYSSCGIYWLWVHIIYLVPSLFVKRSHWYCVLLVHRYI